MALTVLLGGCLVGPDFKSPSAPVAEQWLEAHDPAVRTRHQQYQNWWTAFHDPTLDRLIALAYGQNLTLVAAGTRVLQARAALGVAIGEFYPQSQHATSSLIYLRSSHADPTAAPESLIGNFWHASLGAAVNWELDFWGKFRRGIESADAAYLSSIASYDDILVTLLGDVATSYIGIRTLETQIAIARDNVVKQKRRWLSPRIASRAASRPSSTSTRRKTSSARPRRRSRNCRQHRQQQAQRLVHGQGDHFCFWC